jgi:Tfp pilus assembly protein PilV
VKPGAHRSAMAGVGLIEVLITLVIVAGGVMAMSRLQGLLLTSAASSRQMSDASFIAQRVIEDLRSRDWSHNSLATTGSFGTRDLSCTDQDTTTDTRSLVWLDPLTGTTARYCIWYRVGYTGPAPSMEYKTVQVTVSWTDAQAQDRTYTASTRLQRIGASFSARLLS